MNFFLPQASVIFSKPFSLYHRVLLNTLTASKASKKSEIKGLEKALKLLDLINPRTSAKGCGNHLRLIQECMNELSKSSSVQHFKRVKKAAFRRQDSQEVSDGILNCDISWEWMISNKDQSLFLSEDIVFLFFEKYNGGMRADASILSGVLSSCAAMEAFNAGIQLHGLVIKAGLVVHVSVGSSLISFYAKCQRLDYAYHAFESMSVRNTVSWTAIISGFAQCWQIEMCLELFHQMRQCTLKPNDFTYASLLSACTGSGSLGLGTSTHCQTIVMGFDSYVHVANALISVYAKCGSVDEAFKVFMKIPQKDIISWNSMIAGFAQHGLADQAIKLLKNMEELKIAPDAITFLGVLSSCRHAGYLEQGRLCFHSMLEHGVEPELDHYSCMVDLLGRAGMLEEAYEFIKKMPIHPNAIIWGSLLSSCKLHGNVTVGVQAAKSRLSLEPGCAAAHVQLANLYAGAGCWNHVAEVRKLMKEKGLKPSTGYSWIEIKNEVFMFKAENKSNSDTGEIFAVVNSLIAHMGSLGYLPKMTLSLHDGDSCMQANMKSLFRRRMLPGLWLLIMMHVRGRRTFPTWLVNFARRKSLV